MKHFNNIVFSTPYLAMPNGAGFICATAVYLLLVFRDCIEIKIKGSHKSSANAEIVDECTALDRFYRLLI
ncbi:hypothetical protein [Enterobacter huaxiensis]|uniref:hypothetical protein n=1 Tax=Enterobacter huaxiensis TaxID=2494702 RepID=UPI0010587AB4|nr:hypothetical protein [Enterobacter huaxiensis]UNC52649.1 hypothetical protein D5067_0023990 [Enterobacter huaxiensis]